LLWSASPWHGKPIEVKGVDDGGSLLRNDVTGVSLTRSTAPDRSNRPPRTAGVSLDDPTAGCGAGWNVPCAGVSFMSGPPWGPWVSGPGAGRAASVVTAASR